MAHRKLSTELTLEASQYMDKSERVSAITHAVHVAVDDLGDAADKTGRKAAEMGAGLQEGAKGADNLGDNSRQAARDLTVLDERIDATKRKIIALGIEFALTGDRVAGAKMGREQSMLGRLQALRSTLNDVEHAAQPVEQALLDVGKAAGAASSVMSVPGGLSMQGVGPAMPLIAGAILGAVVSLGPILASELGGVIAGAIGTGVLAGGVLAAFHDPMVASAMTQFTDDIKRKFTEAGTSFVEPMRRSLAILDNDFSDLHLDQIFATAAPDLQMIVQGLGEMVKNIMPGLNALLSRSAPYAAAAAHGFADFGKAVSYLLDRITQSKGSLEGLRTLFAFISGVVVGIADLIYHAGQAFDWFIQQQEKFFHGLAKVAEEAGQHDISDRFDRIATAMHNLQDQTAGTTFGIDGLGASLTQTVYAADGFAKALAEASEKMDELINTSLALDEANNAVGLGFLELRDTLKQNGKHWNDGTKAAYENRDAIDAMIKKLQEQRDAAILASDGSVQAVDAANAKYNEQLKVLLNLAGQAGATQAQLQQMAGTYTVTVVTRYETQQQNKASAVDRAQALAYGGGRAGGGDVMAGYSYTVGENGPETLSMYPWGGTVTPGPAAGGGGSPVIQNHVYIVDPSTGAARRASLISDGRARGVPSATLAAAYP